MAHAGLQKEMGTTCDQCKITWAEFRQHGLFGCEKDYDIFEKDLSPLLQRAHEGATHHTGKVPARGGAAGAGARAQKKKGGVGGVGEEVQRGVAAAEYEED